ncbi:MAG: ribosome small subunit-dependent GTPase A, partial [Aquiluna sp.]
IVANADQMVIVMAAANPEPKPRLVDRYLVAALNAGIKPVLVITKSDLADPQQLAQQFADVDLTVIATRSDMPELETLVAELSGHISVFVGHSGVGKSTLINLLTGEDRSTGGVNQLTGKGKHTSSSAVALRFDGGWIIDTPGIRSFGISAIGADDILKGFSDLAAAAEDCPRGCSHLAGSPDCALDEQVAAKSLSPSRLDSFRRLLASVSSVDF